MPRLVGVDVPEDKRVVIALTYIHGIGLRLSAEILGKAGIKTGTRTRDLSEDELSRLNTLIDEGYETSRRFLDMLEIVPGDSRMYGHLHRHDGPTTDHMH